MKRPRLTDKSLVNGNPNLEKLQYGNPKSMLPIIVDVQPVAFRCFHAARAEELWLPVAFA